MQLIAFAALFASALLSVPSASSAAPAPPPATSFPMTCQIGQTNVVSIDQNLVTVRFYNSNGPASSGLQAGQCAFEDRAVRGNEPSNLCLSGAVTALYFTGTSIGVAHFSGPGTSLLQAAMFGPTKLMNFTVHNNNPAQNCFVIDRFGV